MLLKVQLLTFQALSIVLFYMFKQDDVQNVNNSINIPWSQTFRYYLKKSTYFEIPTIKQSTHEKS
jgi:hypothetical protein